MVIYKFVDKIKFYVGYMVSGFTHGGSWKLNRITELNAQEIRKIMVRNASTYEELFSYRDRLLH
ncbi:MAG TPA: hypothetical protein PK728_09290 [Bacillota bacterium]|nr:hypothetical protein [Bacillota bacterium]